MQRRGLNLPVEWMSWPKDPEPRAFVPRCCACCVLVIPDRINPVAGIGGCQIGKGNHYPWEQHNCAHFERDTSK